MGLYLGLSGDVLPDDSRERAVIGPDHQLSAPAAPTRRSRLIRALVWVALLLVFALAFFLVLRKHDESKSAAAAPARGAGGAVTLTVATAMKGNIGVYLNSIGTVTPVYTASITSQSTGPVTRVYFREGQTVKKGDPLVDIDPRPYQATLLQAQGALERDEGLLAQGTMDLNRYRDAWSRNAIPRQTLDDQEKIVLQQQGTVKNDQGTVQYDQVQLSYTHITAPFTGRIGLRLVDPGNVIQATGTTALAVITQIEPITVIFTIAEDYLGQIQPRLRQRAVLSVDALDRTGLQPIATGTLLTLDNQIDTTTGTVKARASYPNKNEALFPNEFVNTRLLVNTLEGATLIPTSAVQHNGTQAFVYVIDSGQIAHLRPIKAGVTEGGNTQVTGVNPGEVVANSSFDRLQEKAKVVISKTPVKPNPVGSSAP